MEEYLSSYDKFERAIVYRFRVGNGGIGDYIKYFMHVLKLCIRNKERLYHVRTNIDIERYIKLKHGAMYVTEDMIGKLGDVTVVDPGRYYIGRPDAFNMRNFLGDPGPNVSDVFYFTDEVKVTAAQLLPFPVASYIAVHLRLGDKHVETERKYKACPDDVRAFSEEALSRFIEANYDKNIIFFCDSAKYKEGMKQKYDRLIATSAVVAHTSFPNTTQKQTLDAVAEFYLLTKSELIFCASESGFPKVASKFGGVPLDTTALTLA